MILVPAVWTSLGPHHRLRCSCTIGSGKSGDDDARHQRTISSSSTVSAHRETHIQLPFTLLPIYSVMKTISPTHVRAACSLGAGPFYAFWRLLPADAGIAAGVCRPHPCLGYYITPARWAVRRPDAQLLCRLLTNQELNPGMAGALGVILLVITLTPVAPAGQPTG
jgi:ABC-type spermidine/putrescine transport system permease subunit I